MRTDSSTYQSANSLDKTMQRDPVDPRAGQAERGRAVADAPRDVDGRRKPTREEVREFRDLMQRGTSRRGAHAGEGKAAVGAETAARAVVDRDNGDPSALLAAGQRHQQHAGDGALAHHGAGWLPHADVAQAQMVPAQAMGAPPPAAAPAPAGPALAELIERHVRQLLVSEQAGRAGGDVLLRMSDAALPGTDLWLSRTDRGWKLRADVRSRDSYEAIVAGSERLIQRFSRHGLGELEIEPVYEGG